MSPADCPACRWDRFVERKWNQSFAWVKLPDIGNVTVPDAYYDRFYSYAGANPPNYPQACKVLEDAAAAKEESELVRVSMPSNTDYRYEASHLRRMRNSLRSHRVFVPEVYEDLSYRRVLVMEFVQGVLMSDFIALQAALALTPEMLKRTIAARMPRIAMTTSNSTRVKPPWLRCERRRASLSSARSMVVVLPPSSQSRLGTVSCGIRKGWLSGVAAA